MAMVLVPWKDWPLKLKSSQQRLHSLRGSRFLLTSVTLIGIWPSCWSAGQLRMTHGRGYFSMRSKSKPPAKDPPKPLGRFYFGDAQSVSILPAKSSSHLARTRKAVSGTQCRTPVGGAWHFHAQPKTDVCRLRRRRSIFSGCRREDTTQTARCALFQAILSIQTHTISSLEQLLGPIAIDLAHGGQCIFEEFCEQPGGAELTTEWHCCLQDAPAGQRMPHGRTHRCSADRSAKSCVNCPNPVSTQPGQKCRSD